MTEIPEDDGWLPYDATDRAFRIEVFGEIEKNKRLCKLMRKWYFTRREKYGCDVWKQLFEGWRENG